MELSLPLNGPPPTPKRNNVSLYAGLALLGFIGASCLAVGAYISSQRSSAAAAVPGYPSEDAQWNPPPAPRSAYLTQAAVNDLIPGSVVEGSNPLVYLGIGDWGRCGTPTNNPVTRANRCAVQARVVPALEAWAAALKAQFPGLFVLSVGDNYYDGPMPISGNRDSVPLPLSPADLLAADTDPIWDLSFRGIYQDPSVSPTVAALPWYLFNGNHDYGGALESQINWGTPDRIANSGRPSTDGVWRMPALNWTFPRIPIGDGNTAAGNCASMIIIDTCPLTTTYRASAGTDPDRRASTGLPGVFQDQINKFCTACGGVSTWEQMRWLRDQLKQESAACKVVFMAGHHPVVGSGQHAHSTRQQDLRVRLSFPKVFEWAGVDQYLNGHDHIVDIVELDGAASGASGTATLYVTTGAGSNIRTNNQAPIEGTDLSLLVDNGFTVHSANTTHTMVTTVKWDGSVFFKRAQVVRPKLRDAPRAPPADVDWLQPGF